VSVGWNDTLWVLSLELPVQLRRNDRNEFTPIVSKFSLLSTLFGLRDRVRVPVKFVGFPGVHCTTESDKAEAASALEKMGCVGVFPPDKKQFDQFLSFLRGCLWPLFHNVLTMDTQSREAFDNAKWSAYQSINKLFADSLAPHAHENDLIFVQDYPLLLVPQLISRRIRKANVGLFLHVPFPSSEIFRTLPVRDELLRGILCADLVGFHFFEYARHFLVSCKRLLGLDHQMKMGGFIGVEYSGRTVAVRVAHVHIQAADICGAICAQEETFQLARNIRRRHAGKFIFASVDRCERMAGIDLKLEGLRTLLNRYPQLVGKVVLLQYAYPTLSSSLGTSAETGRKIAKHCEELNDAFHDQEEKEEKHVELYLREVRREEKWAAFLAADCLLDTSVRDGLNLNPFEFICARSLLPTHPLDSEPVSSPSSSSSAEDREKETAVDLPPAHQKPELFTKQLSASTLPVKRKGVGSVILSEFTGSARALHSAFIVNPWDCDAVAAAMEKAVHRQWENDQESFFRDQSFLMLGSAQKWAEDVLLDLRKARKRDDMAYTSWGFGTGYRVIGFDANFRKLDISAVVDAYRNAVNRVIFFDHEGTLAPDRRNLTSYAENPSQDLLSAKGSGPSPSVKAALEVICSDDKNTVVILSGRERSLLQEWFGSIPNIGLAAEHGFFFTVPKITGDAWYCLSRSADLSWKDMALELMTQYVRRTQGSFLENKGSSLVFQYRDADPDLGQWQAQELHNYLSEMLFGYPVTVMSGKGYTEVKLRGVDKGSAVQKVLNKVTKNRGEVDFLLAVGDDRSDEDMFKVINQLASSIEHATAHMHQQQQQQQHPQHPLQQFGDTQPPLSQTPNTPEPVGSLQSTARQAAAVLSSQLATPRSPSPGLLSAAAAAAAGVDSSMVRTLSQPAGMHTRMGAVKLKSKSPMKFSNLCDIAGGGGDHQETPEAGPASYTVTVGRKPSQARFFLNDSEEVSELLEGLASQQRQTLKINAAAQAAASTMTLPFPISSSSPYRAPVASLYGHLGGHLQRTGAGHGSTGEIFQQAPSFG